MENFTLLSVIVFIMFLVTAGLIIVRKIEFVRALPAFGIITALLAGVPITGSGENIADFVIVDGVINLAESMFIYVLSMMFADFILKYGIKDELDYLCRYYLAERPQWTVWFITVLTVLFSAVIMHIGAIMLSAILFVPLLLKAGLNKQSAVALLLLATGLGSCLNPGYHLLYAGLLNLDIGSVKEFYYIMAFLCVIAIMVYISLNSKAINPVFRQKAVKRRIDFKLLCMVIMPVIFVLVLKINIECSLILTLSYGFLAIGAKRPFMNLLFSLQEAISKSVDVIVLLSAVGIFMHAVKTQAVVDLMAPLLLCLMPKTATECLLFFTILTPLVLYKGPFNMQGMGAGLSSVIMASTTFNPMVLGMALLSLNTLRKIMDPIEVQNIAVMQYVQVDNNLVIKKVLPYAMAINYFALFYALVISS
ncbi:MAG TPA: hypothetical protein H9979_05600 [Candidatus Megamonas gallistercoris]|nr:hypothetical protein [Candidatus Megamonas gallistercoris]